MKAYSLDEGRLVPCLSLYAMVDDETMRVLSTDTRLERIRMGDNFRYDQWDEQVSEEAVEAGTLTIPHAEDIRYLWHFAKHLQAEREAVRGLSLIHIFQVGLRGGSGSDADALVGEADVLRVSVRHRVNDYRFNAELAAGTLDSQRDFPSVCNKNLSKHGFYPRIKRG